MESQQVACLTEKLKVSAEKPFFNHPITGAKVFTIFDFPHLLKCLRNNLMKYDILVSRVIVIEGFINIL